MYKNNILCLLCQVQTMPVKVFFLTLHCKLHYYACFILHKCVFKLFFVSQIILNCIIYLWKIYLFSWLFFSYINWCDLFGSQNFVFTIKILRLRVEHKSLYPILELNCLLSERTLVKINLKFRNSILWLFNTYVKFIWRVSKLVENLCCLDFG